MVVPIGLLKQIWLHGMVSLMEKIFFRPKTLYSQLYLLSFFSSYVLLSALLLLRQKSWFQIALLFHLLKFLLRLPIVGVTTVFQNAQRIVYGQLIVHASGRNSETSNWLEKLGFERPPETKVNSYIGYATRQFRPRPKNNHANWKVMIILTQPPDNPRMGIIYPAEKDLWWVGILGIGKTYPPTIEEGFLDFVRKLVGNEIYEAIKYADPVSQIYGYRENGSRQVHYEKMKNGPENFIAFGDSVSAFNPFYGQGITTASHWSYYFE